MALTKNRRNMRLPFDPAQDFVATRTLPVNGKILEPGAPFDKAQVTPRRLQQLYESRRIRFADEDAVAASQVKTTRVKAIGPTERNYRPDPLPAKETELPRARSKAETPKKKTTKKSSTRVRV